MSYSWNIMSVKTPMNVEFKKEFLLGDLQIGLVS